MLRHSWADSMPRRGSLYCCRIGRKSNMLTFAVLCIQAYDNIHAFGDNQTILQEHDKAWLERYRICCIQCLYTMICPSKSNAPALFLQSRFFPCGC